MIRKVHLDLIYLGNASDARDLRRIYDNHIRAVVDLAMNEAPAQLGRDIAYFRIPLNDGGGNDDGLIVLSIRTVVSLVQSQIPTLVACSAGMSRAPCIIAASIAMLTRRELDDCLMEIARGAPHDISPVLWTHIKNLVEGTNYPSKPFASIGP